MARPKKSPRRRAVRPDTEPTSGPKPVAFVIMPFGTVSDQVYETLVRPALAKGGYDPRRADTSLNQQNILRTIVEGIESADLIVADLTDRNPNVFYELGLAHARRKNVILLAQSSDDLTFDVKTYKALLYRLEFGRPPRFLDQITDQLMPVLQGARRGDVVFGSPYSDFATEAAEATRDESEPTGFLDALADLPVDEFVSRMELINAITSQMGEETAKLGEKFAEVPGDVPHALRVTRDIGEAWDRSANRYEVELVELRSLTSRIERAAIAMVKLARVGDPESAAAKSALQTVVDVAGQAAGAALSIREAATLVRGLSGVSSFLRKPSERLASNIDALAAEFERFAGLPDKLSGGTG